MRNQIDLLRPAAIFASVVQHGSFRAAAKALNMSAPLVSQMVTDLETRLGVQLLHRTRRDLALTDKGQLLFETSSLLLDGFREGLGAIAPLHAHIDGRLRVRVQYNLACALLARFMSGFQADHPDIELELAFDEEIKPERADGFDLALQLAPLDSKFKHAHLLHEVENRLIAAPSLALALPSIPMLTDHDWIRPPLIPSKLLMRRRNTGETMTVRARRHLVVNSNAMICELVEAGAGFALLPDLTVRQALAEGSLVDLMPGWIANRLGLFATIPIEGSQRALARKMTDALGDYLRRDLLRPRPKGMDH